MGKGKGAIKAPLTGKTCVTSQNPSFFFPWGNWLPFPKIMPGRFLTTPSSSFSPPFPPGLFHLKNFERK